MAKRNWKRIYPTSLRHALELCVEHAKEKKNRSVEQIAELIGEESHFTLYKWLANGRMPTIKIRPFENVCGIDFVTQWLAHSNNKLLIPVPTGKLAEHTDIARLTLAMQETSGLLLQFYEGDATSEATIATITMLMEDLAFARGNIEKHDNPELELGA
jgi:hypothetical protein